MPPYNCIPGSTLITFVVYIAVRLLYAYRVFNVFKQLKHPPINQSRIPLSAIQGQATQILQKNFQLKNLEFKSNKQKKKLICIPHGIN